jgi:hypothetical protein
LHVGATFAGSVHMKNDQTSNARRQLLQHGVTLLSGAFVASTIVPRCAAAGKAMRDDFSYQDRPKNGKSCASCRLFTPKAVGLGTCALVEGEVSPNGWCMAFSPRDV